MCCICLLFEKEKLTKEEALIALFELAIDETQDQEHLQKVYSEIENTNK